MTGVQTCALRSTEELLKDVFDLDVEIHRDPIADSPMFIIK